jgi:exosortase
MSQLANIELVASAVRHPPWQAKMWWQALILVLLTVWLYSSIFLELGLQWWRDPNFSHGFLVPPFIAFVLWRSRHSFLALPGRPSSWGLLILVFGLCVLAAGSLGAEVFLSRLSLLPLIAGLLVLFFGWHYLRSALFPLCLLFLMIPIPSLLFNPATLPLQLLASKMAAATLPVFGVPVFREGNIINLPAMSLEVAQACSGVRSLFALITLAVIYGYLAENVRWIRIALVLAAVPIAIATNGLRIIGTGLLVQYWNPDKASGFFHEFSGGLLFLISLLMLALLHQALAMWFPKARMCSGL